VAGQDEDEVWRSIVANYGDRPELADDDAPAPAPPTAYAAKEEDAAVEERFVPPPPPPLPRPENKRLVAWLGLFAVPTVLLACLVTGVRLPSLAAFAMVAWFVGGFTYLVLTMPRGPRDPGDDGAVV
jgi:hypothetical protein